MLFHLFERLQRSCKRILEQFGACSGPANTFPNGLMLAAFLQTHSRTVWRLQRFCKRIPEWFNACCVPASKKPFGFGLATFLQVCPPLHWTSSTIFLIVDERPNRRFVYIFPCIKIQYFSVGCHDISWEADNSCILTKFSARPKTITKSSSCIDKGCFQ